MTHNTGMRLAFLCLKNNEVSADNALTTLPDTEYTAEYEQLIAQRSDDHHYIKRGRFTERQRL